MKMATGKVVGEKVVLEGVSLEEGTSVTVLAKDNEGGFDLTPEQEAELLLSIQAAEPGVGAPVLHKRAQGVRRLHLARIRYHLYYRLRGDQVEVLAVCHTSRGAGPSLQPAARRPTRR